MNDSFSGSVLRMAIRNAKDPEIIKESWFLKIRYGRQPLERMFQQIYQRSKTTWWKVDFYAFADLPKREPAMVYQRRISTRATAAEFLDGYFRSKYSLKPDFDPYASNPRGFDPALRGSVDARSRELVLNRLAHGASDDDPWYDVATAYEHWSARTLMKVPDGYLDAVWLFSTGIDAGPDEILKVALDRETRRLRAELLGAVGPFPANESATLDGIELMRAFGRYPGGGDEFQANVVDLSAWN